MRLRDNYEEITYETGDIVTIIPDLREQEQVNIINGGRRLRAGIEMNMFHLQGRRVLIIGSTRTDRYTIDQGTRSVYSADMFLESYVQDDQEEELPLLSDLIYEGMYLFSVTSHELGLRQELFKIRTIGESTITGHYIIREDKERRGSDSIKTLTEWTTSNSTWLRNSRPFRTTTAIRRSINGKIFISGDLYIPDNDVLMERFGVSNKLLDVETKKEEGHLDLPNIFEGYKYPVVNIAYTNNNSYGIYKDYGFKISDKLLITYDGKTKTSKKIDNILGQTNVVKNEKLLKELILNWSKANIKSYEKSVELFGHKTRKKAMFEATDDKDKKKSYKITNVKFNYSKEGSFYHVVELNDGTLNLKFLLDDITLILPTINDYVAPKDRTIKVQDECKLVNNKITPIQKGSTVKVLKMFNRHQVHNPKLGKYDKNTVALVVDKSSNKQFECKIKQLKKI